MTQFDGYLTHELIEDLDDPGHLLVISQWTSASARTNPRAYASPQRANELVSRPRTRVVGHAVPTRA